MLWVSLALGVLTTLALHVLLRSLSRLPAPSRRRLLRTLAILSGVVALFALLRFGAGWLAAGFSTLAGLLYWLARSGLLPFLVRGGARYAERRANGQAEKRKKRGMSAEEAASILGVSRFADAETIKQAHRRLMQKLHPDHGGNEFLAQMINQAKDRLLES